MVKEAPKRFLQSGLRRSLRLAHFAVRTTRPENYPMLNLSALLPTFLITLREGVEAALVVGIVMAYLSQAGQTRLNAWVYRGIAGGLAASALIGVAFSGTLWVLSQSSQVYAPIVKQFLEGGLGIIAIGLLSWMLLWMTRQAKSLKSEIEGELAAALSHDAGAGWGVFGLIFLAVLREGFETVVFIAVQFQQGWFPALGALGGLLGAVAIGTLLFRWGVKINLRAFFQVMGGFLLLIVGGLVIGAMAHVDRGVGLLATVQPQWASWCGSAPGQTLEGSCFLGSLVWDGRGVLPDRRFPGIVLKTLFGYRDRLYLAEILAYASFMVGVGSYYWRTIQAATVPTQGAAQRGGAQSSAKS